MLDKRNNFIFELKHRQPLALGIAQLIKNILHSCRTIIHGQLIECLAVQLNDIMRLKDNPVLGDQPDMLRAQKRHCGQYKHAIVIKEVVY
ncbi:hypothetical protein D3C81_2140500 [compost metagenome]